MQANKSGAMNYQVFEPSSELRSFVKCFWTLDGEAEEKPVRQRIVPDGCMEMIFHYGDLYRQYPGNGPSILQPRCFIFGQITIYLEIAPTGTSGIVAARFFPEGLLPFLRTPLSALENKAVALTAIFGDSATQFEDAVINADDNRVRIKLIENFLLARLNDPGTIDRVAKSCVETIFQTQGQLDVSALAGKMNINRRQLERKFTQAIGLSPKQLSKMARLQAALKMLDKKNFTNLTALAHENGYFDQAHFIKDFKEFTGVSPKSFFADNLKLSGLFISEE